MKEKLIEIICNIKGDQNLKQKITPEDHIINTIGLDSLQMIAFILKVEEEFEIEMEFESLDYKYFNSVNHFSQFLETLINKKNVTLS